MLDSAASEAISHFEAELAGVHAYAMEVPERTVVQEGREVTIVGDIERARSVWHEQGENPFRYQGTCGLASVASVLRMLGINASEAEIVSHAREAGLCEENPDPEQAGGTTPNGLAMILGHYGAPANIKMILATSQVTDAIDRGQGVIVSVNSGTLWWSEIPGELTDQELVRAAGNGVPNHAIEVVGYERDPSTHQVTGVFVNDTGHAQGAARLISAEAFARATSIGAQMIVTDLPTTRTSKEA